MFEKEVKKYLKDSTDYYDPREPFTSRKVLQMCMDCAELGYNKVKEEMQKNGLALQSDMDKTIEQNIVLKKQLEKLKCCEMCKHKNLNWGFSPICEAKDNIKIENPLTCKCDKWEIKEK